MVRRREPLPHKGLSRAADPSEPRAPALFCIFKETGPRAAIQGLAEVRCAKHTQVQDNNPKQEAKRLFPKARPASQLPQALVTSCCPGFP